MKIYNHANQIMCLLHGIVIHIHYTLHMYNADEKMRRCHIYFFTQFLVILRTKKPMKM